jgi:arginase
MPAFTILGAPIDSVGFWTPEPRGTELAPAAWRAAGLSGLGWPDGGDLPIRIDSDVRDAASGVVGIDGVLSVTTSIRTAIAEACRTGQRTLLLGGCCTIAPAAVAGARDALGPIGLIYVDGHLDMMDGTSSPTGEAADMPVAVMLGDGPIAWRERVAPAPVTTPAATAVLGYRDADEVTLVRDRLASATRDGLLAVPADAIHAADPWIIGSGALDHAARAADAVWLHVDLDVLDEAVFPATDYLQPGGLDWAQLIALLGPVVGDPRLMGWSIACYNPEKDPGGRDGRDTVAAINELANG